MYKSFKKIDISKRCFLLYIYLCGLSMLLTAQNVTEHIQSASKSYVKKDFPLAIMELEKAVKEIKTEYSIQIASLLPSQFGIYKQNNSNNNDNFIGLYVNVRRQYSEPLHEKKESQNTENPEDITDEMMPEEEMVQHKRYEVTITNNLNEMSGEIIHVHLAADGIDVSEDDIYEAIKVNGYRGLLSFRKRQKEGRLGILIGAGLLMINSYQIEDHNSLIKFAESVDFEKIIRVFGK